MKEKCQDIDRMCPLISKICPHQQERICPYEQPENKRLEDKFINKGGLRK